MVHTLAHTPRLQAGYLQERPNAARIAAMSGAIAVNAIALLLLLMPMSAPLPIAVDEPIDVYFPKPEEKKPEIVPVERTQKPTVKPETSVRPQPRLTVAPTPTEEVVVDHGSVPVVPSTDTGSESITVEPPSGPIAAVRLEYADAPRPAYPRDALRIRAEGTVMLQVLVDVDGRPLDVQVQTSSGNRSLDDTARKHVLKRWRFKPAMRDGVAMQAYGLVPIAFTLKN
jgi:periplasmic protein TonB